MSSGLEEQVAQWRGFVRRRAVLSADDVAELEEHLRGQVDDLRAVGLSDDEAFLVAVSRMGSMDALSREFAAVHSERLWKQLVLSDEDRGPAARAASRRRTWLVLALAVGAALTFRAALWLMDTDVVWRAGAGLVLPWLAGSFCLRHRVPRGVVLTAAAGWVALLVVLLVSPFEAGGDTLVLAAAHAPVVWWLLAGAFYTGGRWRDPARRMDFVRFTGEWAVYYFLLAAGGGALIGLSLAVFGAVGVDASPVLLSWVLPCGAAGATVVAAWLVEAKQSVVENMAPVLARVFSPLVLALLVALLVAFALDPRVLGVDRDLLVLMTVVLVVVLGLWLYTVSARRPEAPVGAWDRGLVALLLAAVAVDLVVLVAMAGRIAELGLTPNRAAALGLNLLLLGDLVGSAWLAIGFARQARPFSALERWQTSSLPVLGAWAALVAVAWGPLFSWT
ncbi:permease prefix domain 1-containing protein [Nocardioides sp. GY 10127]|uniref:permease prefix domain 1-containing protein n=1 Tax=Nocardioides sp. GY 10127 TaxID=2569762 RepID=UPI0010A8FCF5|nr:permease prefix domain 1-containing protein [Nocardioides sp. GY 10127]TIC86387.1 hypothetical protein E8D37_00270 [Nocardioides sp. GY 10127]